MKFFDYFCNVFLKRHDYICSSFCERTATSNKENKRANLLSKEYAPTAQTTPLDNRGCRRPVHGNGWVCAFFLPEC